MGALSIRLIIARQITVPGVTRCPPGSAIQDRNTHHGTLAQNRQWGEIETRYEQSCVYVSRIKWSKVVVYFKIQGCSQCGTHTLSTQLT